ncbi:rod shape-determining protein [Megalodesulfovibrio gigas]|uniref:Cell shape-determining protein MreB n=1 Tax=Megalodesulfovibrio gigas (strain ATCC 19364 / DSM 1382 / NCIMB 9332 / VKM B-1759) TaxID=1121448 RepID=T2G8N7_MEGG1|nr:rod shape-determining protein [Megalodesulfovibrio gigas]AGW12262.1 putative rod shape-determining protein MreB [Megalodesulfovibrio gigas DSM 1382 = ATCC 19364]
MFFNRLLGFLGKDLAMDLGTANTLLYTPKQGIVLNEPSVVAYETPSNRIIAVGASAKELVGRTPGNIVTVRPMKDGVIADFDVTKAMISYFIHKVITGLKFVKPRMVICVPTGITAVEKRAVIESGLDAGAREVLMIEEPMAAAIGAGCPIHEPTGTMVVDIGGGTSEVAVISMGAIAYAESVRAAGDWMNATVQRFFQERHQLFISENMAEAVKIGIGSAYPLPEPLKMNVPGKDVIGGGPKSVVSTDEEIRQALQEPVKTIVRAVRKALEKTPPELVVDVARNGILLAGGGALLKGLDQLIQRNTNIRVNVDDDPLTTVVRGTGRSLEDMQRYKNVYIN